MTKREYVKREKCTHTLSIELNWKIYLFFLSPRFLVNSECVEIAKCVIVTCEEKYNCLSWWNLRKIDDFCHSNSISHPRCQKNLILSIVSGTSYICAKWTAWLLGCIVFIWICVDVWTFWIIPVFSVCHKSLKNVYVIQVYWSHAMSDGNKRDYHTHVLNVSSF